MPRDIPVGNGKLLVTLDCDYQIRDIYYPHVGLENHTEGHAFFFGVWVEGKFRWINNHSWQINKKYKKNTLVTDVELKNSDLNLKLICHDTVDFHENIYLKKITVHNLSNKKREVRIFFNHDFHLYGNNIGDTALYDPATWTIIHYKNARYFLIGGCCRDSCGIREFATGQKGVNNKEGTWRDAEDGHLSGNPITQGAVDSTVSIHIDLKEKDSGELFYWIAAGRCKEEVMRINRLALEKGPNSLIKRTHDYWKLWLEKENISFDSLPESIIDLYKRSLLILRTQIDDDGAILAANDTDIVNFSKDSYSYMWPRDGALTAYALDLAGYPELTKRFFTFCGDVLTKDGYLLHKYNPNKTVASSWHPWIKDNRGQLPIQEDETALVIWALWNHFKIYRDIEFIKPLYKKLIKNSADFLLRFRDKKTGLPLPSYDLWEERHGIHTFTVCSVYAGLIAAAKFTKSFGDDDLSREYTKGAEAIKRGMDTYLFSEDNDRFLRMINFKDGAIEEDLTIDASVYALFEFGVYDPLDPKVVSTMNSVKENLWCKSEVGGLARYQNDYYHQISQDTVNIPGNPWFICTMWLSEYEISKARTIKELDEAIAILNWVADRALPSGVLAEQAHPYDNTPLSVSPLTWSHATFVMTTQKYLRKKKQIELCPECERGN